VETVGDAGLTFDGTDGVASLTRQLERAFDDPEMVEGFRDRARVRAQQYSWDAVTDQYESLLEAVRTARGPGSLPPELLDQALRAPRG
jgi:glycosyltransferase involved in cell wall biosynthesis